ncbi:MAG: hypothetical protein ABI639_00845 [Thermoanaerobaculia bacterium]
MIGLAATPLMARTESLPVRFSFAPPANKNYVQREIHVETGRVGVIQKRVSLASETAVRVSKEAGRIFLLNHIDRVAKARDGKPVEEPMVGAMTGTEVVYVLRPDGGMERIDGLKRFNDRVLAALQGEDRAAFEKRVRDNRLEQRTRASWFETTEILAGQTLELDRDYFFDSAWPTDDGWIQHQTLLRLGPWEKTVSGRQLRVKTAYVTDAKAALPGALRLQPRVQTTFAPANPGPLAIGLTISGNASRLVDPTTLTIWRDQSSRQIRSRVQMSEEMSVTVSSEETSDITLVPAPASAPPKPAAN